MSLRKSSWLRTFISVCVVLCGFAVGETADVSGNWTVTASQGRRKLNQMLSIHQDGDKINGSFKGPRQSGTLSGSVSGNSITFHVDAKMPLDYEGTVNGDTITGTVRGEGKTGDFTAKRSK
jgi:hypothetical protein